MKKINLAFCNSILLDNIEFRAGIHIGSTIEGVIGSSHKIDATYSSSDVDVTFKLSTLGKFYST